MSAQAGIFNRNGQPLDRAALGALSTSNAACGPDRHGRHIGASVGMLHWALHLDALATRETQPYRCAGHALLTWDGRLDNRDELALQLWRDLAPRPTDLEIVGAAYAQWGNESFARFDGDWSLAIFDESRQTLTLARDVMGTRQLYYRVTDAKVIWSTCLAPLVTDEVATAFDEDYLVEALTRLPDFERTVYRSIKRVPPAHWICFTPTRAERRQFWDFAEGETARYKDARDYGDRLRELFVEAVAVRLRTRTPAWIELSGGYDSSAVACVSDWLCRAGRSEANNVRFVSYINPNAPESNERQYIAHVERQCDRRSLSLPPDTRRPIKAIAAHADPFVATTPEDALNEAMTREDGHVLLTGEMGDYVMAKSRSLCGALLDHLAAGHVRTFARELQHWSARTRTPVHRALRRVLTPLLPAKLQDRLERQRWLADLQQAHRSEDQSVAALMGLTDTFVERALDHDLRDHRPLMRFPPPKRVLAGALLHAAGSSMIMTPESMPRAHRTHPYLHRPLMRFVLAIPQSILWRPETPRALMKEAFACILPEGVRKRDNKSDALPGSARDLVWLADELGTDYSEWEVVARGYAEPRRLAARVAQACSGMLLEGSYLRRLLILEAWLRGPSRALRSHTGGDRNMAEQTMTA